MMSPETPPPSSEGDSVDLTTADEDLNLASPCQLERSIKKRKTCSNKLESQVGELGHVGPDTCLDLKTTDEGNALDIKLLLEEARKRTIFCSIPEKSAAELESNPNEVAAPVNLTCNEGANMTPPLDERTKQCSCDEMEVKPDIESLFYPFQPDAPAAPIDLTADDCDDDSYSSPMLFESEDNSTPSEPVAPVDLTLDDDWDVCSVPPKPAVKGKKRKYDVSRKEKNNPVQSEAEVRSDSDEPLAPKRKLRMRTAPEKKPDTENLGETFFVIRDSVKMMAISKRRSTGQKFRYDQGALRCRSCRQPLSSAIAYAGPLNDAIEEKTALKDATLQLSYKEGELPLNKLTLFSVYDDEGHLCPLDGGCIERNENLRISGYIKPIYEDDPSASGGIPVNDLGPVTQWWIGGYDGGPNRVIGITTGEGEYILMNPSSSYSPLMEELLEKIYLGKLVIEYLQKEENASYEELLNHIQSTAPPSGVPFTEDTLLRHVQFVCDQVVSYDEAGYSDGDSDSEDDWRKLATAPCMRTLISLAGGRIARRGRRTEEDPWRRDSDEEKEESDEDSDGDYEEENYRASKRVVNKTGESKPSRIPRSKATTTPLVKAIFDSLFQDELDTTNRPTNSVKEVTKDRCGVCEPCKLRDCGDCVFCAMRAEFGDSDDKMICIKRRCVNLGGFTPLPRNLPQPASDDETINEISDDETEHQAVDVSKASGGPRPVEWIGEPVYSDGSRTYYQSAKVGSFQVTVGDFVRCEGWTLNGPDVIGRIVQLFEDEFKQKCLHQQNFIQGFETILGDSANPYEIFAGDSCESTMLEGVTSVISVQRKELIFSEWQNQRGCLETPKHGSTQLFFTKRYDVLQARFEDIPPEPACPKEIPKHLFCPTCYAIVERIVFSMPRTYDPKYDEDESRIQSSGKPIEFSSVIWRGEKYSRGVCVYLSPDAFVFKTTSSAVLIRSEEHFPKNYDEDLYPERYRRLFDARKAANETTPDPFCIGVISKIVAKSSGLNDPDDITLHMYKCYRPENTSDVVSDLNQVDLTMLFASDDDDSVSFSQVQGKCYVAYGENLPDPDHSKWTFDGPDRFYFTHAYEDTLMALKEPNELFKTLGLSEKDGKDKDKSPSWPTVSRPLRCLDVFAGCGGLSDGLHKSGISESKWAVEVVGTAADAFKLNNPDATVFTMDCNQFLKDVIAGETEDSKGQRYPQNGEVELLVGGPPCQGFSGMNRFNSGVYSSFKNSLVVSFLSFCDFYRPRYFILENVRNFVSFNKSMILKLTMRCLLEMGYQVTVAILQAGHYGVPQTRRRAIIIAAAPGEKLPMYPEPLHVFHPRAGSLAIVLNGVKIDAGNIFRDSAPLRTITVYDAMSDLPAIENGDQKEEIEYARDALTHFQKLVRPTDDKAKLRDHICKNMCEMVAARIEHVPLTKNADWRDLPNIEVVLKSGQKCNKLMYEYEHKLYGRSGTGAHRGVCACNTKGGSCDPMDRQINTLIPWCMPHTAHRNHNWSGLYGRLQWGDFFGTTVTNPEPMGKQGRVLHPYQHRVVSVRECARSQGFDDSYRFSGPILEKHRQVGNAVPPPMGKAIGLEIRKCLYELENKSAREGKGPSENSECHIPL